MEERKPEMLMPALIAGALAGLLASLPGTNLCCCLWPMGAGVLAAFLLQKEARSLLTGGDGAVLGALAGLASALVRSLLLIPLQRLNMMFLEKFIFPTLLEWIEQSGQQPPAQLTELMQGDIPSLTIPGFFLDLLITAAIFAGLGALGGVIAASLFKKKTPPPGQEPSHAA